MLLRIQRLPVAFERLGKTRSPGYEDIKNGLLTQPIKLGERSVGLPEHEVDAIVRARIAGASKTELKALVAKLHAERLAAPTDGVSYVHAAPAAKAAA